LQLCDRVALMGQGRVVEIGKPEDVLTDEALLKSQDLELPEVLRLVPQEKRKEIISRLRLEAAEPPKLSRRFRGRAEVAS
jgi:ABC-type hemin transport system ATPase subunit